MTRWASRFLLGLGCLLILAGAAYAGLLTYLGWQESVAPSTQQVLVLPDGRHIPLIQPTPGRPATPPQGTTAAPVADASLAPILPRADAAANPDPATAVPSIPAAHGPVPRAPLRVRIPRIGVDWPVVLSDNDHMPRFKGVGWMFGSAYPGLAGNFVLFGHLDGPYATLGRLHELQTGDVVEVTTTADTYRYQVRTTLETTPDDVSVLIPTTSATATLITCAGTWNKTAQMYDRRLIVTADLLTP